MKKTHVLAAVAALGLASSYFGWMNSGEAGCGCGTAACPCGGGPKTAEVGWDDSIATPVEPAKNAEKPAPAEFTLDELKSAKPLLVYYYVDGLTDTQDDSYQLSQRFETVGLVAEGVIPAIKTGWRAKKVALDAKADRKKVENQSRLEFWSYTGVKVGGILAKDEGDTAPKPLMAKMTAASKKSAELVKAEIKRLEAAAKTPAKTGK